MIRAVYDRNVILSGIGWNGSARNRLKLVARRHVFLFVTDAILAEYESVIPETLAEETPGIDPLPKLAWAEPSLVLSNRPRWENGAAVMRKTIFTWPRPWARRQNIS